MPITTRPPRPSDWGDSTTVRTDDGLLHSLIWHHIIPFSVLRDTWNHLEELYLTTDHREPRIALLRFLSLCDPTLAGADALVDRLRDNRRRASHSPIVSLEVAKEHLLHTAISWPTWNIVEGPKNRTDDPGDDYLDRFISGLTEVEYLRMRVIDKLYDNLAAFAALPAPVELFQLGDISSQILHAKRFVSADAPIRFRKEMWQYPAISGLNYWCKLRTDGTDRYVPAT